MSIILIILHCNQTTTKMNKVPQLFFGNMTVEGKLNQMLKDRGMSSEQSNAVMVLAIPEINSLVKGYQITLKTGSDSYPEAIYKALFMSIQPIALKWINENKPQAWFRPMFV